MELYQNENDITWDQIGWKGSSQVHWLALQGFDSGLY